MAAPILSVAVRAHLKSLKHLHVTSICSTNSTTSTAITACTCLMSHDFHTSSSRQKDRRKDKAVSQYLYYKDHEKTMRHRNLPLLDLPDYSYTDGRPTELSLCQSKRQEKNFELAKQIVELVAEVRHAENLHHEKQQAQETRQRERLEARLKDKRTQYEG